MSTDNGTPNEECGDAVSPKEDKAQSKQANEKGALKKTHETLCKTPVIGKVFQPKPKVAVIRMGGVIRDTGNPARSGISHQKYAPLIEKAFKLSCLQAVVLLINSPGGSPAQSQLIGDHLRAKAKEKDVPVLAFVEDVAASGGYWLACAADEIYALPVSIVGSIGVISSSFGFGELIEKHGVERRIHTAGKDKSFLDPFVPERPDDLLRLKDIQQEMHDEFIGWVKERRKGKLDDSNTDLFEGGFWLGKSAKELGLIDGFGEMRAFCRERFGEKIKFAHLEPKSKLMPFPFGGKMAANQDGLSLSIGELPEQTITALEDRIVRGRYGL